MLVQYVDGEKFIFESFSFARYVVKCQMWLCSIVTYIIIVFMVKKKEKKHFSLPQLGQLPLHLHTSRRFGRGSLSMID